MIDLRAAARTDLADLELALGEPLHQQPVHATDQWTASMRDLFAALDTDLTQPDQARAALAGAYIAATTLIGAGSHVPYPAAVGVAHLWRHLVDRVDAAPGRRRRWRPWS